MGFLDFFKKKGAHKEDKLDRQILEAQEKNAALSKQSGVPSEDSNEDALKSAAAAMNLMDAFSSFVADPNAKVNVKTASMPTQASPQAPPQAPPRKKEAAALSEAEAAYQAAFAADNAKGGEWDDEILALYQKAADLRHPVSAELVGEHYNGIIGDYEVALSYLKLAAELGRDVYYTIGTIYDIQYQDAEAADEWYQRGVNETGCKSCAEELENPSFR